MTPDATPPDFAVDFIDLASPRLGSSVEFATDEFFGAKDRMLKEEPAVFIPGKYDDHGKWMDGCETKRRRGGGHDWALVKLGVKGIVRGVNIDTSHFTGNYPPGASLEGCLSTRRPGEDAKWLPLVPMSSLGPSRPHYFPVSLNAQVNWLRLQIFPDGGVARLRVYGEPVRDWSASDANGVHELSALKNGGRIVAFNDAHYGNVSALLSEGRGVNMGDGWETRRRREPGNDWIIIELGHAGTIERIEVDTAHYRGNYPDRCSLQAANVEQGTRASIITQSMFWPELMAPQKLRADAIHDFSSELARPGPVTHVRLNIHPDGGVSRFRVFGRLAV